MKKEEIEEILQDKYGMTADRKKRYHPNILSAFIEICFNDILYNLCKIAISFGDLAQLDMYIKSYPNVNVLCNDKRDEYYSILPAPIIQLPKNRGIRSISAIKDRKTNFYPRENGDSEIMENLEFAEINTVPTFYIENYHVFYDKRMTKDLAEEGVLMKLIIPYREWKDEDVLPLPSGEDLNLITAVENLINQKEKEDQKPNSKPDDNENEQKQ